MEYPNFKVCVRCFTFNHSKYITNAMNGFVMQRTNFPYVCCIVDDASNDGEQAVIRKYVSDNFDLSEGSCHFERETDYAVISYAQHKSNQNCYFAVLYLKENHHSIKKPKLPYLSEWQDGCEYLALCEGDDYWIDKNKLQLQVDYLDVHLSCSLSFHAHKNTYPSSHLPDVVIRQFSNEVESVPIGNLIKAGGGYMATSSMLYRKYLLDNMPEWAKNSPVGDFPKMLILASRGEVSYINEVMSCYRQDSCNSWSQRLVKDNTLYLKWYYGIIKMMNGFDDETGKKYHKYVSKYLFSHRLSRLRFELYKIKKVVLSYK